MNLEEMKGILKELNGLSANEAKEKFEQLRMNYKEWQIFTCVFDNMGGIRNYALSNKQVQMLTDKADMSYNEFSDIFKKNTDGKGKTGLSALYYNSEKNDKRMLNEIGNLYISFEKKVNPIKGLKNDLNKFEKLLVGIGVPNDAKEKMKILQKLKGAIYQEYLDCGELYKDVMDKSLKEDMIKSLQMTRESFESIEERMSFMNGDSDNIMQRLSDIREVMEFFEKFEERMSQKKAEIPDNRSPLTPELERQAWKDNEMYDHADAIMRSAKDDSKMYDHAKAIKDAITGKDEEEVER